MVALSLQILMMFKNIRKNFEQFGRLGLPQNQVIVYIAETESRPRPPLALNISRNFDCYLITSQ